MVPMLEQIAPRVGVEGVVVVIRLDAEHKRRLLYNAITQAKRWCNIIVQSPNILAAARRLNGRLPGFAACAKLRRLPSAFRP